MGVPVKRRFTDREKQIVRLIARGDTVGKIAGELHISPHTVKAHADALRYKLGVDTRREIPAAYLDQTGENPFPAP